MSNVWILDDDKSIRWVFEKALAKENIFVWSGHSYALEVVKSLTLLDSGGVVRVGPVHYNGIEEIDDFIEVLGRITTHQN